MKINQYLIGMVIGIVLCVVGNNFICNDEPVVIGKSSVTEKTTTTEKVEGKADTTSNVKRQTSKVTLRHFDNPILRQAQDDMHVPGSSTFDKIFNYEDAELKTTVTTYPAVDSLDIENDLSVTHKTITRVDTVKKTETIKTTETITTEVYKKNSWQLAIGSAQLWNDAIELSKYAELSYQHKVWFFYLKGFAGVYNGINDGFNELKINSKVELNIPLN